MEDRESVIAYMKEHKKAWPYDISLALKIEFGEVMKITTQLIEEGIVEFADGKKE